MELGHIEGGCCQRLVRARIRKGRVTDLVVDPCPDMKPHKATPELARVLKAAQRRAAAGNRPPKLPMPVATFMRTMAFGIKTLFCLQICIFGWCFVCCQVGDTGPWICGRVTIDTTKFPYPEP